MGRPRKRSDQQILAAAARVMARVDPPELTLALIAAEAGVTAGALVQRFGSRRNLMLALADSAAQATPDLFSALLKRYRSPLAVIRAYGKCHARGCGNAAAVARSFSYLLQDLTDPDLKARVMAQAHETRLSLRSVILDAIRGGELAAGTNADTLARLVEACIAGSLLVWAFHEEGSAARWVTRDLDAVLQPYLA